jgi:PDZ domain
MSTTVAAPSAGVGGETSMRLGRVQSLQLGRFALERPVTGLAQSAKGALANPNLSGNIGAGILRRFKVIFDYRNHRMILEPNDRLRETFESDMSGMVLTAEGVKLDALTIYYVTENSPPSEAGLRVGDVITPIDNKPSSALALDDVREMFKQEGREHLLSIKRGQQASEVKIKLRRLI